MKKIFLVLVAVSIVFMFVGSVSADLSLGLVAYYPFNGNANDESGNGNHAIINGATLTYDRFGNPDNAYSFNGVSGDINIGGNVKPPFPVSVSVWVNANDLDANGCGLAGIVRNDQYDSGSYRYGLAVMVSDGYLHTRYYEGFSTYSNRIGYISNDVLTIVRECNYQVGVTTVPASNTPEVTNRLLLNRCSVSDFNLKTITKNLVRLPGA